MNLNEYQHLDDLIYKGLKELGIRFWMKDGELYFKYPQDLGGDRISLYKFIKDHQAGLIRILQR